MENYNDTPKTSGAARFTPVSRQKAKLRMAITGPSGSGKTVGSLFTAYGITGDWAKIALIDTERERARMYANRSDLPIPIGAFMYAPFYPPYTPQAYRDLVAEGAAAVGSDGVVIVDSFSHAWMGDGGVLDIKDRIQESSRSKDGFSAWNKAGKEQSKLIDSILAVDCHIICTMRSKMAYEVVEVDGKKKINKLGLEPVQRGETEYEFDIVLDIQRDGHIATASKDVTFLDSYGEIITPSLGERLARWLDEGEDPPLATCDQCGHPIRPAEGRSIDRIIQGTLAETGRKLCLACFRGTRAGRGTQRAKPASMTQAIPSSAMSSSVPPVIPVTPRALSPVEEEYQRRQLDPTRNLPNMPPLPWEDQDLGYPFTGLGEPPQQPRMPNPPPVEQLYILPPPRRFD